MLKGGGGWTKGGGYQEFLIFSLIFATGPRVPISAPTSTNSAQQGYHHGAYKTERAGNTARGSSK